MFKPLLTGRVLFLLLTVASINVYAQQISEKYKIKKPEPGPSVVSKFEKITKNTSPGVQTSRDGALSVAATYTVTNTLDSGTGSLRKAIDDANNNPGRDIIQFNIPATGVILIQPLSFLPEISESVVIDGTTQPGYASQPLIEIDGVNAGIANGFEVNASGCLFKGIAITRFSGVGIGFILGQNIVEGCFIGISADGITDKGNGGDGIVVFSAGNSIGNPSGNRNVISGNGTSGIRISEAASTGNRIMNNYIGTNYNGTAPVGNDLAGITLFQTSYDTIGGQGFAGMNIISGNFEEGIHIEGGATHHIIIKTNRIGTSANGTVKVPNKNGISLIAGLGSALGSPSNVIIGGKWSESQNLISGNLQSGVNFFMDKSNGTDNVVAGNLIGTNASGNGKLSNNHGIYFQRSDTTGIMPGVKIGGAIYDSNNVISGNDQYGIWINMEGARNNLIHGNYIGTTRATPLGVISALPNGFAGIAIENASKNHIGDADLLKGNIIAANLGGGIHIQGSGSSQNTVYNNFIGTNSQLGIDLGNHLDGVYIEGSENKIGGKDLMNEIAYNKRNGVFILTGTKNRLQGNAIYKNSIMGIDLSPLNITPNDSADIDTGPNMGQNFPVLDSASLTTSTTTIHGRFYSEPNKEYTLYFYKNDERSPSHFGEGRYLFDSMFVTTDDSGWVMIDNTFNHVITDNQFITALAVDADGNTSEFSRALCLKDSDGDGIFDCWESPGDGIDINADGIIDLDLSSLGAKPDHKDIFVEVDYMQGYRPMNISLQQVHDAFALIENRYVNNPDNQDGINLIVELDTTSAVIPSEVLPDSPWPRFFQLKKKFFGTDIERASTNAVNILASKNLVYRYCIWGNKFGVDGYSGIAELTEGAGGNDFLVTLGSFNTVNGDTLQQAGTFMHELGHTLGLYHGGNDDVNYKPNYYSVMNYIWQYPDEQGLLANLTYQLTYSPAALGTLNENHLNEAVGLSASGTDYPNAIIFPYADSAGALYKTGILWSISAIDWDGNGDSSGFALRPIDLNNLDSVASLGDTLTGFADWPALKYNFRHSPNFKNIADLPEHIWMNEPKEMTPAIYNHIQSFPPYGVVPPKIVPAALTWLGTLGGNKSEAYGISDNGKIVTGDARDSLSETYAFKWTAENGMVKLGKLSGNGSAAKGISGDGSTIVGTADSSGFPKAFKWTQSTGMVDIGSGAAYDVSFDGSKIIINYNQKAFLWSSGGTINLGTLGGSGSGANAISSNGSVVVGYSYDTLNDPYAFRWDAAGMKKIGTYYSFANGVSDDGNTITGSETGAAGLHRAFRWTAPNTFEMNIAGNFSQGSDLSYNGKYLVGDGGNGAFILTRNGSLDYFNVVFADLLSPGSEFYSAIAVTPNGRYVTGYGHNSVTNRDEAYLLDIGGPQPSAITENKIVIQNYNLHQNYPNPFNPVTTIRYDVPSYSKVNLTIYNILGQQVITLVDEEKTSGTYNVKWNAAGLPSGIYFYRLQTGSFVQTKKMILLK